MPFQLLTTAKMSGCSFDSVGGLRLILVRGLIAQSLDSALGGGASLLLAEPVEKSGDDILEWHTEAAGAVRPFGELSEDEQSQARAGLREKAELVVAEARRLKESASKQKHKAGEILSKIAGDIRAFGEGAPSPLSVFLVGGSPVIAGWGVRPIHSQAALNAELSEGMGFREETEPAPDFSPPDPPDYDFSEGQWGGEYQEPRGWAPAAGAGAASPFFWNFLRALLAALLTLLLAALVLAFLFSDLLRPAPLPDISGPRKDENSLARELYGLRKEYSDRLYACPAEEREEASLEPLPLPKDERPENPLLAEDDKAPELVGALRDAPPTEGSAFDIPESGDPNDVSFMEGCWKSDAGLFATATGLPVYHIYCFDKGGKGDLSIETFDKNGKQTDTCKASASVTRNGKQVTIVESGARCPKTNMRFVAYQMTCSKESDGRTSCVYTRRYNSKAQEPFYTKITYMGKK